MVNFIKKEYTKIALLIIIAAIIGLVVRFTQPELEIDYPEQDTVLSRNDFTVNCGNGEITVGVSSWEQVTALFPGGENLGLSTIYRPPAQDCLLQFTEDENILNKMHISSDRYMTSRGVKVGDPFSVAESNYGPDYAKIMSKEKPGYFEAVYGSGNNNNIVFQVRDNKVVKIILQHEIYQ